VAVEDWSSKVNRKGCTAPGEGKGGRDKVWLLRDMPGDQAGPRYREGGTNTEKGYVSRKEEKEGVSSKHALRVMTLDRTNNEIRSVKMDRS